MRLISRRVRKTETQMMAQHEIGEMSQDTQDPDMILMANEARCYSVRTRVYLKLRQIYVLMSVELWKGMNEWSMKLYILTIQV